MTSSLDNRRASRGDRARNLAFHRDFWPGIIGYLAALTVVLVRGGLDGDSGWRYVWALLPVLPAAWIARAVIRQLGRIDDYQRLLMLQGLAIGFVVAMLTAVTAGFLGVAGLQGPLVGWVIFSVGMLAWSIAGAVAQRR